MRFEVPQFINIQDKLFWIFTFREALYLIGGGGIIYLFFRILPTFAAGTLGVPVAAFTLALVFYKPNGRPFINMVESFVLFTFTQKFYLWRQREVDRSVLPVQQIHQEFPSENSDRAESREKISNLAWSLDVLDFDDK